MPSVLSKSPNLFVSTQAFVSCFNDDESVEHGVIGNGTVLGNSKSNGVTKYKVLGLSEGIHNGLRVLREDIQQMARDVEASTDTIPVVLDHSFNWNDVVGKVLGVTYLETYVAPNGKQLFGALLMDIELLPPSETTPKLNETLYRLEMLPELAKFSVAFKFTPITDENGNITVKDLVLKHLAIVTNPADPSTQILERLSKRENVEYMSFDLNDMENVKYRGFKMPTTKRNTAKYAQRRSARFDNERVHAIARNPLTPGTYPIRDVQSIVMRPGQPSLLGCECGDELYGRQNAAAFAKRRAAARFAAQRRAQRGARFGARKTARFTQYGTPTVYGNPWEYPISDTYPVVNQLIALRKKEAALKSRAAALGHRADLLEQRENGELCGNAKMSSRAARRARLARAQRRARFASQRRARFDDGFAPIAPQAMPMAAQIEEEGFPEYSEVMPETTFNPTPAYDVPAVPAYDVPENTAAVGTVSTYVSDDVIPTTDPVVQAYVDAGLIVEDEIPVVEAALRQHRSARFAQRRARFSRRAAAARRARLAQRRARFAQQRPAMRRARFAQAPRRSYRNSKFEGLINEYMVPSANLPRNLNVNIREQEPAMNAVAPTTTQFRNRRAARFGANRASRRSGSFFVKGGLRRDEPQGVPEKVTSIAPSNSANASPATFVGKDSTNNLIKELNETKNQLKKAEELSVLRSQALSMQFADKDLIMTFSEDQLKKYIESKGTQQANFAAQMNPFVSDAQNKQQLGNYVAEFADSFTKGNYQTVCGIDQITRSAESKAEALFGGN